MKKSRLLLLDANIVIVLCKWGLWGFVLEKCEILLARTLLEVEAFSAIRSVCVSDRAITEARTV